MGSGPPHRGAMGNIAVFAPKFIRGRMAGFQKDMKICLTPAESETRPGLTHAYFPALAACCGTLEYLTALDRGSIRGIGWQQVSSWARKYLPQDDYSDDVIRIIFEAFRHPVAHRGIASGVWIDRHQGPENGRRLTWKVLAGSRRPAIQVVPEKGSLTRDSPWECSYTHRVHIYLKALEVDIRHAAQRYITEITTSPQLQENFEHCMRQLYPA